MESKNILKNWKIWVGVIAVIVVIAFIINYNNLSKYETM